MDLPECPVCTQPASKVGYKEEAGFRILDARCGTDGCEFEGRLVKRWLVGYRDRLFFTDEDLGVHELQALAREAGRKVDEEREIKRAKLRCDEEVPATQILHSSQEEGWNSLELSPERP